MASCTSSRPQGTICQGLCPPDTDGPIALIDRARARTDGEAGDAGLEAMASGRFGEQLRALMRRKADVVPQGVPERALADLPRIDEGRLDILALSVGGPYGAFGAGSGTRSVCSAGASV